MRDAYEMWYRRKTDPIMVCLYNFTELTFVEFSCGKYRLFCAKISMAIETFRYVIAW